MELLNQLAFEGASLMGRAVGRAAPRNNGYLNLGCGFDYHEGYCNADFFGFATLRRLLGKKLHRLDWELDIRFPFKCPDGLFQAAFCEHVIEHLSPDECAHVLKELNRVVRPGGVVRVSVPSLEAALARYAAAPAETRAGEIAELACNYGHRNVFDIGRLCAYMTTAGFTDVRACAFGEGADPMIVLDQERRRSESIYAEGVATGA